MAEIEDLTMLRPWESESAPDEVCRECDARYRVLVTRFPRGDQDQFNCQVCGALIRSWNDTYSYSYTLINHGTQNSGA